ncbi:MAG TPA: Do family serine endopeptidase [Terriglobales bacterium]|nr:Do family serine endopeptidase [Terriglobales bacterium]
MSVVTSCLAACGLGVALMASSGPAARSVMSSNMAPFTDAAVAPLLALDRATEAVAERITPAVVNIQVVGHSSPSISQQQEQIPEPFQQFFNQFQGPQFEMPRQPQVFEALGTGVIVSPDGYIVTNNHVVDGANQVEVTLNDRRRFTAKVIGTDKPTDLAVIKINASGLTSAAFGDSSLLKPGETVLAIGDPMGMDFSVTRGIVSAVNRSRTLSDGPDARGAFIQTDAPINHGNSGGPLVNARGEVVGINTEILSSSGASAGIGFAIPSDLVQPTAASLIKNGKVVRGYLGVEVSDLTPDVADSLNETGVKGALVNQVNSGSPALAAGLKPYDVITRFNGHPIAGSSELQTLAGAVAPGETASVEVLRHGQPKTISVTLGDAASASGQPVSADASNESSTPKLGMQVTPTDPNSDVAGLRVQSVTPGSPAMVAGIGRDDIIEQVNEHPVTTVAELQHQLAMAPKGKDLLLLVHSHAGDAIVPVPPASESH